MSLVSCLVAINEAKLINRCDLARVLHKEDLDGFEGYSLSDCECRFLTLPPSPIPLLLLVTPYVAIFPSFVFQRQVQKATLPEKPLPTLYIPSTIVN